MTLLDRALDASVVLSYGRQGFARHARHFPPGELEVDLAGRVMLVTGANAGLGLATTRALVARGARVVMLCRDTSRGDAALATLRAESPRGHAECVRLDVSDLGAVRAFVRDWGGAPVDALVHNAAVLPARYARTPEGHEVALATNLLGPHLLTAGLAPCLRRGARVVMVSSGGMFTQRLDVDRLEMGPARYDGAVAYARAKRALVALVPGWAARLNDQGAAVHAMHPGWADTPGVRSSLPGFWRATRHILRSPAEGADTVVFLASAARAAETTGGLWFDRAEVSPFPVPGTRHDEAETARLWAFVEARCAA